MKISIRDFGPLKVLAKADYESIIKEMRKRVKSDPVIVAKFKEYKVPLDNIDLVHIEFTDLDVSAKTKNKKIYLNRAMLNKDSEVGDPTAYLAHELIHYLQQSTGKVKTNNTDDYLDQDNEVEAFKAQIDYKEKHEGKDEAEEYVDELLDYHKYKGKKREKKEKELLD